MTPSSPESLVAGGDREPSPVALWSLPDLGDPAGEPAAPPPEAPAGPAAEELAYQRGLEEGRRLAREDAAGTLLRGVEALRQAAQRLEAVVGEVVGAAQDNLHALAVAVARQVVLREVATDPAVVRDLVRRALEAVPLAPPIEVRLHPDDLRALEGQLDFPDATGRPLRIQWHGDPAVERGGCIVETPHRHVDGRLEVALRTLYERLGDG